MDFETFVSVDLSEDEFEQVIEWLGEQEIQSGLGKLYDRLMAAVESRDDDVFAEVDEDEQTDD